MENSIESQYPTPRTDAVVVLGVEYKPTSSCAEVVDAEFVRDLERELAEARERQIELEGDLIQKLGENKAKSKEIEHLRGIAEDLRKIQDAASTLVAVTHFSGCIDGATREARDTLEEALAAQNPAGDGSAELSTGAAKLLETLKGFMFGGSMTLHPCFDANNQGLTKLGMELAERGFATVRPLQGSEGSLILELRSAADGSGVGR